MSELVEVGRIVKPHGLRGEVVVELITDREEERLAPGSRLEVDRGDQGETLTVVRASRQRPATDRRRARWIVQFEGTARVEDVEALREAVLRSKPLDDPGSLWVHDVVGAEVVLAGSGDRVGTCVAVVANPAADLLELDGGALVPVVFVVEHSPHRIIIDPPPGLLEI